MTGRYHMKDNTKKQYKDTFIRKLLSEKRRAIEVANALLDENFDENIDIIFHDLTDSLLERYNDISFSIAYGNSAKPSHSDMNHSYCRLCRPLCFRLRGVLQHCHLYACS